MLNVKTPKSNSNPNPLREVVANQQPPVLLVFFCSFVAIFLGIWWL